ncbi:AhpC-TSA-domain-containing protein [Schizophyllum commune H4-8]|nr:AhpC-TSA-domain-containing protein [Schizophyllum commune H4-8]KAI5886699.1 AhpC-TSA-domain-containing protein [Schizophyllum commune H4-8]
MPPRKAAPADPDVAPRRSSRITAQPKAEESTKKTAKRTADGDAAGARRAKKVKAEKDAEADGAGDKPTSLVLPSLTLKNEKDEDVDVSALAAKADRGVVLFLVPKADTPGCTTQACGFRDVYSDFEKEGFHVYCVSADKPTAQAKWQTKKSLPYSLLSDPERTLIGALGAAKGGKTARSHFVFGKDGKLLDRKMPVKPVDSPRLALEFIRNLKADGADAGEGDKANGATDGNKKADEAAEAVAEKVEEDKEAKADASGGKTEDAGANEG